MQFKELPIGYWIKQADLLLTKGIDDIQSSFGMTRTDWQILHAVSEKAFVSRIDLINLISPFADTNRSEGILTKFIAEHLINEHENKLTLTGKGIALHSACFEKQKAFRQSVMIGISEHDYQITILTLQKVVDNITKSQFANHHTSSTINKTR